MSEEGCFCRRNPVFLTPTWRVNYGHPHPRGGVNSVDAEVPELLKPDRRLIEIRITNESLKNKSKLGGALHRD